MKILAVCLGNICRSPLAEGILSHLSEKHGLGWIVDSAGTSDWHVGEQPCQGSMDISRRHGLDISRQAARQVTEKDLRDFDLILAMDAENYNRLRQQADSPEIEQKIKLVLNFSNPGSNRSVPDSYYTGNYAEVFDLLYEAGEKIVEHYTQ